jgi:pimeloyl-ACP methyl ester carboxylesterase
MSEISHSEVARRTFFSGGIAAAASIGGIPSALGASAGGSANTYLDVTCKTIRADGVDIFYREAGAEHSPVLLLLHGFPNSSLMFQQLMPRLADRFRLIAPDIPSFGFTAIPAERHYSYTFESFATTIGAFTDALGLKHYGMYVFDFGAPIGFRHALAHPERIVGIISQNGNAYEEGLGASFWKPVRAAWKDPSDANRALLRSRIGFEGIKSLYLTGVRDSLSIPPENYWLDSALAARPGITDIQVDLKIDYETNIQLYPKFQEFLRQSQVPILAIWGENDLAFIPAGAHAFLRDSPHAVVRLLDTGHFALITHLSDITAAIRNWPLAK